MPAAIVKYTSYGKPTVNLVFHEDGHFYTRRELRALERENREVYVVGGVR